jgi:SnoaL-like domain
MNAASMTDREAITDQIYRYCRAMDRIDHALGYSIWHEDGTADYGPDIFQGSGRDFIDHVCKQHAGTLGHSHQMSNIIIEIDGDKAASESAVTATLRIDRDGKLMQIMVWSRYIDTWSKRDGCWAIDHRIAINDFDEIREVTPLRPTIRGSRDRSDPSYAVLTKGPQR